MPTRDVVPLLEVSLEMNATPQRVWSVVADPLAIAALSPQVLRTVVVDGAPVRVGTRLYNINRQGLALWPTRAVVTEFEPVHRFAFRVRDNRATWSFTLEPVEGGTRVTHRREMNHGTTAASAALIDLGGGGQERYAAAMRRGMQRTLDRVREVVER